MKWWTTLVTVSIMVVLWTADATSEPKTEQQSPGRAPSHSDYRRGLFALSKVRSAPIVMLGDSLTEVAPWTELTGCPYLVNRGIGGDNTFSVLERLDEVLSLRPRAVFLMIGVNDINHRIPKEKTVENLGMILDRLDTADIRSFVAYVLPVAAKYPDSGMNHTIDELNQLYKTVLAKHPQTTIIDLRPLVREINGGLREDFTLDGIHLNQNGYAIWRDSIGKYVTSFCQS